MHKACQSVPVDAAFTEFVNENMSAAVQERLKVLDGIAPNR